MEHTADSPRFQRTLKASLASRAENEGQCPEIRKKALGMQGGQLVLLASDAHSICFVCLDPALLSACLTLLGDNANCMVRKG